MKRKLWVFLLLVTLVMGVGLAQASDDLESKLAQAVELCESTDLEEQAAGIKLFQDLQNQYPDNYQVLWKGARGLETAAKSLEKPLKTFEQAKEWAEKAVELYPDQIEGHYWLSALMGRVGEEKGILNSLFMVKPMKRELDKCLEIDPEYPDTYYVLGMLYWKVPGWPISIGNKKKAIEYAAKAVNLNGDNFSFRWGLYEAYDAAGKDDKAREVLETIINMPVVSGQEADAEDYKGRAEKLLD